MAPKVNRIRPDRCGDNALYSSLRKFGCGWGCGWHHFLWKSLMITTNHINNFLQQNLEIELNLDSLFILRFFTQFEGGVYEQVLLIHYSFSF